MKNPKIKAICIDSEGYSIIEKNKMYWIQKRIEDLSVPEDWVKVYSCTNEVYIGGFRLKRFRILEEIPGVGI